VRHRCAAAGPGFSVLIKVLQHKAYLQSTWTKITFDAEEFDTNNNFASSRFTPDCCWILSIGVPMLYLEQVAQVQMQLFHFIKMEVNLKRGIQMYISSLSNASLNSSTIAVCKRVNRLF